jgi:arylsulfatase A-like enzyme
MADDWGWPYATPYGDKVVKTPAFDRLAKEGILFERAFVSSPSCTPSRNAILTGQEFYRLEKGANLWNTLDVSYPNFMFLMRDAGYDIGHWRKAWGPGFPERGGYEEHPCGPESTFPEFLNKRDSENPFCFWFGTSDPHRGYRKGSGRESGIPLEDIQLPGFFPDNETVRSDIADYYYEVQRWDNDVSKALALLEEKGLLENTIVVMTGDHGMPFPRCKANLYDWGTRVPLVIRWGANMPATSKTNALVSLTDLAPTFLEAAGAETPSEMTGKSLIPLLAPKRTNNYQERDTLVFGRERHTPSQKAPSNAGYPGRAIRTDQWLLIHNLTPDRWPAGVPTGATHHSGRFSDSDAGPTKEVIIDMHDDPENHKYFELCFGKRPEFELYNCEDDRDQIHNLASESEYAEKVRELRTTLEQHLSRTGDPRFTEQPVKFEEYRYR